jgi:hypothetical protein
MAHDQTEERIRAKAYELWETDGRPDGQQDRHWEIAKRIIAEEDFTEPAIPGQPDWRPEADGLNPIQGSSDASESRVNLRRSILRSTD